MSILDQLPFFSPHFSANNNKTHSSASREDAFLCLILVINRKTFNTLVVRVQLVEESSALFPPVGRALLHHHGASFLGL